MAKISDKDVRDVRGYNDVKVAKCICCGCDVNVTKFASEEKVKCQSCKDSGAEVNQSILDDIIANKKNRKKKTTSVSGSTKVVKCTQCGADVIISKFATSTNVVCDSCRGVGVVEDPSNVIIDLSKLDRNAIPNIEDYNIMPSIIRNEKLREVECPACGAGTKILGILDYSSRGLIIHYQCIKCHNLISVSEQCDHTCSPYAEGEIFDYSGEAIRDLLTSVKNTRLGNICSQLMDVVDAHGISVDGIELPPYRTMGQRPNTGFVIPTDQAITKLMYDLLAMDIDSDIKDRINNILRGE